MTMAEWADRLVGFLQFNERNVLDHKGKVSRQAAEKLAHEQYEAWSREQRTIEAQTYSSDFDWIVKRVEGKDKSADDV